MGELRRRACADSALSLGVINPLFKFSFGFRFLLAIESVFVFLTGFGKGHFGFRLDAAFADPQQQNLRHLRHFLLQQLEAVFLESLQDHLAFALTDTQRTFRQFRAGRAEPAAILQFLLQVFFEAGEQLRLFGLDVQARFVLRIGLGDVDDFIESEDLQPGVGRARAVRVFGVVPTAGIEGFQLGHGEGVGRAVLAIREFAGNVGGALQIVIVQHEQHAVLTALQVHFQIVGTEVTGQFIGCSGGFRCIEGRATVGDHRRVRDAVSRSHGARIAVRGGMRLTEAKQQAQHEGAFGESGGHGRVPFAGHFKRRTF